MAQDQQTISCAIGQWTQLTNANVTDITFQVLRGDGVFIRYTTDTTTPTEADGLVYKRGEGEQNAALADLTALASAARVWAKPVGSDAADVYVDHA